MGKKREKGEIKQKELKESQDPMRTNLYYEKQKVQLKNLFLILGGREKKKGVRANLLGGNERENKCARHFFQADGSLCKRSIFTPYDRGKKGERGTRKPQCWALSGRERGGREKLKKKKKKGEASGGGSNGRGGNRNQAISILVWGKLEGGKWGREVFRFSKKKNGEEKRTNTDG